MADNKITLANAHQLTDVPPELTLIFERLRGAIAEMKTRELPSLKREITNASIALDRAIAERNRAEGAANALEHEIAPLLEGFDLEAVVRKAIDTELAHERSLQAQEPAFALPISTTRGLCPPNHRVSIVARPQVAAYRPDRLVVSTEDFLIHDLVIGNRSQFAQTGPIHAKMFGPRAHFIKLELETVQTAMDVRFDVEYVGDDPAGQPFHAVLFGIAVH